MNRIDDTANTPLAQITDSDGETRTIVYSHADGFCYLDGDDEPLDMEDICKGNIDLSYEHICAMYKTGWDFNDLYA